MRNKTSTLLPELWIPGDLRELYPLALADVKNVTVLDEPHWGDMLPPLLATHVREAVAYTEHSGEVPGLVPHPQIRDLYVSQPLRFPSGDSSVTLHSMQPYEPTDQDRQDLRDWQEDQDRVPAFRARVDGICEEVVTDPRRAWDAFVHLRAVTVARTRWEETRRAAAAAEERRARYQCPICRQMNTETIGTVEERPLLPGFVTSPWYGEGLQIRSCLACWNIASAAHIHSLGDALMGGAHTRRDLVLAALASH